MTERRPGFTLIEIILVLAIISVLVAAVAGTVVDFSSDAREVTVRQNLKAIRGSIQEYMKKNMEGPTTMVQLGFTRSITEMLTYDLGDKDAIIQVEVPDVEGFPPPPPPANIGPPATNSMVASQTKWVEFKWGEDESYNSPPDPQDNRGFRNIRITTPPPANKYQTW